MKRTLGPAVVLASMVLGLGFWARAAEESRTLYAIERPAPAVIEALAGRSDLDVRWVERGLVLFEAAPAIAVPPAARVIATRSGDRALGLLRASEAEHWRKAGANAQPVVRFLESARVARLDAAAGEVWVLFAAPGTWPSEIASCHGGLVLPAARIDPRAALDVGPTAALRPYLAPAGAPFTPEQRAVLADVSADSLLASVERLATNGALSADRYVFNDDLDGIYAGRVEATMQRAVAGIAGATVERRAFPMRPSTTTTIDAHNIVARIPGSVPGTGTFVVCGHVDATGSNDPTWVQAVRQSIPVATPGAEDNATGVACVLEMLRCIADGIRIGDLDFAFDLEFVAFSGEEVPVTPSPEQGLVGSEQYVRAATQDSIPLLGTLNFDMVGYDRVAGNLQIVHNPASRFLAEMVRDGTAALVPPSPLTLTLEVDEARASDHNSFWNVNAPAILAADAQVNVLRQYNTYHRPIDEAAFVMPAKLAEVTRAVMAGLLRLETGVSTQPQILFSDADLQLRVRIGNTDVRYQSGFNLLYPGAPLKAALQVRSIGARYIGPVRIQLETQGASGNDAFYDRTETADLPTGDRLAPVINVPIRSQDLGLRTLLARVTWNDSLGPVTLAQTDTFIVDTNSSAALNPVIAPNPVRQVADARVVLDPRPPGELLVDVYDLEGELIASSVRSVSRSLNNKIELPLVEASANGGFPADLSSGAYVVRVRWRSSDGSTASATTHLVVQR